MTLHIVAIRLVNGRCNPPIETAAQLEETTEILKRDLLAVCHENGYFPEDVRMTAASFREEAERMTITPLTNGFVKIANHTCKYHSDYKGWKLYRAVDGGQPRMCYFAVGFTDAGGMTILTARNLSAIKDRVTEAKR